MTHPGGQPGTGPSGPGGTGPRLTAEAIVAGIDDRITRIAASLPPLTKRARASVVGIWRRSHRLSRLDKAA